MKNAIKREPCMLVCRWPNVSILFNKQTIITLLLALVAVAGQAFALMRTPSDMRSMACWCQPGTVRPMLLTTRWQGRPRASGASCIARPTRREWLGISVGSLHPLWVIFFV